MRVCVKPHLITLSLSAWNWRSRETVRERAREPDCQSVREKKSTGAMMLNMSSHHGPKHALIAVYCHGGRRHGPRRALHEESWSQKSWTQACTLRIMYGRHWYKVPVGTEQTRSQEIFFGPAQIVWPKPTTIEVRLKSHPFSLTRTKSARTNPPGL
jgi:hypothetical protein